MAYQCKICHRRLDPANIGAHPCTASTLHPEVQRLLAQAESVLADKGALAWLYDHTDTERSYERIVDDLRALAALVRTGKIVTWRFNLDIAEEVSD